MINRFLAFCIGMIAAASILIASTGTAQTDPPRTYYDSLDLSSPEAAVETMTDAFQRDDYFTVYLVLSREAQFRFQQTINLLKFERLIQISQIDNVLGDTPLFSDGMDATEHSPEGIFLFDEFMLAASLHDAFLIDLRNTVIIVDRRDIRLEDGTNGVDLVARLENKQVPIIFRTVQSVSGRWRVYSVRAEGAAEDEPLWSLQFDAPEITVDTAANWETACDDTPPEQPTYDGPSLTISPDCGKPGAEITVTLTGTGFVPVDEVQIWIRPSESPEFIVPGVDIIRPDENGSFSVQFTMPAINLTQADSRVVEIVARQFVGQE